jgi:hypothetical protein
MDSKRAAEILLAHGKYTAWPGIRDACMAGAEALELLEWYGGNPGAVWYDYGYSGDPRGWARKDPARNRMIIHTDSLIEALRAAKKISEEKA